MKFKPYTPVHFKLGNSITNCLFLTEDGYTNLCEAVFVCGSMGTNNFKLTYVGVVGKSSLIKGWIYGR